MNFPLESPQELSLKTVEGYTFFKYSDIISFEASGNCTLVHVVHEDKPKKVLHNFTEVEEKIWGIPIFFKCHRSHIINIEYLNHFCIKRNLLITKKGDVPISESYVKAFKEWYCR